MDAPKELDRPAMRPSLNEFWPRLVRVNPDGTKKPLGRLPPDRAAAMIDVLTRGNDVEGRRYELDETDSK
jgi:hypothetical protein